MAQYFVNGQTGSDSNSGTSEGAAWKTLAAAARQAPANPTIIVAKSTYNEPMPRRSGVQWKAQAPGEVLISGGVPAGSGWTRDGAGTWSKPWTQQPFGAFQGTFEKQGKHASYFWRDYNQRDSNPMLDINPADPASQFKFKGGRLYLRTIGGEDPNTAGVMIAVRNVGIDLGAGDDGNSDVTVEGFATRYHGSAVGTGRGRNVHLIDCDLGYCGKTGVWLTQLTASSMENCVVQGAGNWAGHYEDVIAVNGGDGVILKGVRASWGGHSGIICLGAQKVAILGCVLDTMGGSGITLKQGSGGALIEGNTILRVAGVAQLTVHRVPHAAIQGSMDDAVIRNNTLQENGLGFLLDSTNVQSCRRNLIERNTVEDCEGAAVDLQENEDPGGVEGNIFRANIFRRGCRGKWVDGSPQTRLIFVAFANRRGLGANQFTDNFWDNSGSIALNGDPPSATNDGSRTDNRGATTSGSPPPPPPTAQKPVLAALTPPAGPPGVRVTATGSGFGSDPYVIVSVADGGKRLTGLGGSDSAVSWTMPADVVTGEVRVRRTDVSPTQLSDPLTFTVTGSTPPPPPPPPPVGELRVTVSASPNDVGGSFSGTVRDTKPLPAGSTITVTARTPDGRSATATATIAGDTPPPPPPPPPTDGNRVEDTFLASGTPAEQELLYAGLRELFFPWSALKPGLQRMGLQKVLLEWADLSQWGAALTTVDGERLVHVDAENDDGDDDHTHVVWNGMLPGSDPNDPRHYVAGLAWSSGKLQIEQRLKTQPELAKQVVGFETAHEIDFFYASVNNMHPALLQIVFQGGPITHEWWGGSFGDPSYWSQPGESFMSALAIAYGRFPAEDPRFTPYFRIKDARAIRQALKLARTDTGKI